MDQECSRLPRSFGVYMPKLTPVSSFARQRTHPLEIRRFSPITEIAVFACPRLRAFGLSIAGAACGVVAGRSLCPTPLKQRRDHYDCQRRER